MELEFTPLYKEVLDVIASCQRQSQFFYKATFLLGEPSKSSELYEPVSVDAITIQRNYVDNYTDEISLTCKIPLGKYAFKIYPNRTWLRVNLQRCALKDDSSVDEGAESKIQTYNAVLIEDTKAVTQMQGAEAKSEEALDLVEILTVRFQLFDQTLSKIRTIQVGGIYRDMTPAQITRALINRYSKDLGVEAVDMKPPNNETPRVQTVITSKINLCDLPGYLHNKHGIYNSGLGTYIQNKKWYLFPLYDTSRFKSEKTTLTLYIVPKTKFPEIETTYRIQGDSLVIIATSNTDFRGDNDINYIVSGNGVRYADDSKVVDDYISVEDNKASIKRANNTSEFTSGVRGDNLVQAPVISDVFTSNPYVQFTDLAKRKGGTFKVHWENSHPAMLTPGLSTRIVYFDKGQLQEAYGVYIGGSHVSFKAGGMFTSKHVSTSMLYFFTNLLVQDQ